MPNENYLEGIKCPNCGQEECFDINALITCRVTDEGSNPVGDHYWDQTSFTYCPACDYQGALKHFQHPTAKGE
jgi:hypothetical protein